MIYLDYQATTPVAPEVAAAMRPWIEEKFANPHSPSRWGREAAAAIEVAREAGRAGDRPRRRQRSPSPAARPRRSTGRSRARSRRRRQGRNASSPSRPSMPRCSTRSNGSKGRGYRRHPPAGRRRRAGRPRRSSKAALDETVALVAVMLVNNEIGVIQPVAEIARLAHDAGALMLCDAVQGFGRMRYPEGPDLVAVSAHKIHGPKGDRRLVDARRAPSRRRCSTAAGRSRACARAPVAGAVRRLRRGGEAGVRAARCRPRACRAACGTLRWTRSGPAGRSTAA